MHVSARNYGRERYLDCATGDPDTPGNERRVYLFRPIFLWYTSLAHLALESHVVVSLDDPVRRKRREALDRLGLGLLAYALAELLPSLVERTYASAHELGHVLLRWQVYVEDLRACDA